MADQENQTYTDQAYRELMSNWVTGVGLITTSGREGPVGCTANALTSLSLSPPQVLVCFSISARTLHAVRFRGRFCINVLSSGQADVSRVFASKRQQAEKFAGILYCMRHGVPVIDACVAYLICDVSHELEGGDHAIVIGSPIASGMREDVNPLVFFRGSYSQTVSMRPPESSLDSAAAGEDWSMDLHEIVEILATSSLKEDHLTSAENRASATPSKRASA